MPRTELFRGGGYVVEDLDASSLLISSEDGGWCRPAQDVAVIRALLSRMREAEADRDRLRGIVEGVIAYRCPEDPTWECAMQMGEYQSRLRKKVPDAG